MTENRKKLSVVIPTYNEEENVEAMTNAVRDIFERQLPQYDFEIIYIDNHSKETIQRTGPGRYCAGCVRRISG